MSRKYFCDLCKQEMSYPPRERRQITYSVGDGKGTLFLAIIHITQGELCDHCAQKVVAEGKMGFV